METQYFAEGLTVKDFKRLEVLNINFDRNGVAQIIGENEQGKSATVDAVIACLCGNQEISYQSIRNGTDKAVVTLKLVGVDAEGAETPVEITRTLTHGTPKGTLKVMVGGNAINDAQDFLNVITAGKILDPGKFMTKSDKERIDMLLEISGKKAELEEIDQKHAAAYSERTLLNRDKNTLLAAVGTMTAPEEGLPDKEISIGELNTKRKELTEALETRRNLESEINECNENITDVEGSIGVARALILDLKKRITEQEEFITNKEKDIKKLKDSTKALTSQLAKVADPSDEIASIDEQMSTVEEKNQKIRNAAAYRQRVADAKAAEKKWKKQDEVVKGLESEKANILENANLPTNLSFSDGVLYHKGIRFENNSYSERMKVAMAVSMFKDPALKLLYTKEGGHFDKKSIRQLDGIAKDRNILLIIERPDDENQIEGVVAFTLEAGRLKGDKPEDQGETLDIFGQKAEEK